MTVLLSRVPLHPVLFAAYGVLVVYAANLAEVLPVDAVPPLGQAMIAAAAVLAFATLPFMDPRRGALVATALVVAYSFFGHLSGNLAGFGLDERAQLVFWAVVATVATSVAVFARRTSLATMTLLLNVVSIVLVTLTLASIVPYESARAASPSQAGQLTDAPVATATRTPNRDIYFIILDRYGSAWSLEHRFGITDNDFPGWLAEHGFQVVPGARNNYRKTDFSLAATLSMNMLDDLGAALGPDGTDLTPARERIKHPQVGIFLRANGYRFYQTGSWYAASDSSRTADDVLEYDQSTEFSLLLHDLSIQPAIEHLAGPRVVDEEFRQRAYDIAQFQLRQLERLAVVPGRKFVFAHILLPHPPYVFRADGSQRLKSEADAIMKEQGEAPLFRDHLAYINARIKHIVEMLLAGPDDRDPIIVIAGDEGPFECYEVDCTDGSPESLGIRFGVLGAFYLPGLPKDVVPPNHSSVNDFRLIFREYFGADLPDLPQRSYSWPDDEHPYAFYEVTDILPLPGG
jgi:hypothetical protein